MSLTITIPGAVNVTTGSTAPAVLTIGVGVPGAQGPQGPAGQGVPVGGTAGQFLTKIDGTNYNTDWTTVNLSVYAVKANNLSDLTSASTARSNLGLGTMATASAGDYSTTTVANGLYYPLSSNPSGYLTSSALTGYATQSYVAANYAPIAAGLPAGGTAGQVLTKNSGTDYDDSWQTLIPGDRYLTTSTTSNSVSNGAKTFTVGTGLSYSSQQDVVISYDASNHMHALVTSYDSGTGVLVVDVQNHTGSGTYASWTVNVGGTTPLQSVYWGEILGTLGDQTDLATALNAKLETSTAASTYAALAGATFTGEVVTPASTTSSAGLTITPGVAPTSPTNGEIWATTNDLQVRLNGVTETLAEQSWVTSQGYITSSALTPYAPLAGATFTGLVTTLASSTTTAGLNLPHGSAPTTPVNGDLWTTTGGFFWRQNGATKQAMNLGDTQTVTGNITFNNTTLTFGSSTATSTVNIGTGATVSASTRTINIGTASAAGSTNNVNIGGGSGTSTTTIAGTLTATGTTLNLGNSTAASTINVGTGATLTSTTKAVNIGTNGVAGSTTNIAIGSTTGTSTTTLQGTTNGVTAAADTNSTALATTAFVVGQAGSATPLVDGTAAVGTSLRYARQDHVHPTDTSRAPLASPALTGTPTAPTATAGTNTTQIATTAFVTAAVPAFATNAQVVTGTSTTTTLSPGHAGFLKADPRLRSLAHINNTSVTGSGAITANTGSLYAREMYLGSLATGRANFTYGIAGSTAASFLTSKADRTRIDFSKRIWMSGSVCCAMTLGATNYSGDANTNCRIVLGGYSFLQAADMNQKGIGWKKVGGTTTFVTLTVHNGTTLTDVASSFAPVADQSFDWAIYSDGAGNVTLYINGSQVATTSAGPVGTTTAGNNAYIEQVDAPTTPTVRQIMHSNGGWIYLAD